MEITIEIVKQLIEEQFPQWKNLPVRPVAKSGHDNRTFHLGEEMTVRLPSGEAYAAQAAKEIRWLPYLQERLDFPISKPVAAGKPTSCFPFPWSVNRWVEGDTLRDCAVRGNKMDTCLLAKELAAALRELQAVPCEGGPAAGAHNFYRGGSLTVYHQETVDALEKLKDRLPAERLYAVWEKCISRAYAGPGVWVHGDVAPGNILMRDGRFYGLIDFGILGTGDPACDYAMAWTYFGEEARRLFLEGLPDDMVNRARGWALWKALITYDDADREVRENAEKTVGVILAEEDAVLDSPRTSSTQEGNISSAEGSMRLETN